MSCGVRWESLIQIKTRRRTWVMLNGTYPDQTGIRRVRPAGRHRIIPPRGCALDREAAGSDRRLSRAVRAQAMGAYRTISTALMMTVLSIGLATPSHAISGSVRLTVIKAGLGLGAGAGHGVLTFRHRNYRFVIQGVSVGLAAGASIGKFVGRADYINEDRKSVV